MPKFQRSFAAITAVGLMSGMCATGGQVRAVEAHPSSTPQNSRAALLRTRTVRESYVTVPVATHPEDISADGHGDIWVAGRNYDLTKIIASTLTTKAVHIGASSLGGLSSDPAGNIWVSEYGISMVCEVLAMTTDAVASPCTAVYKPVNIASDATGDMWVGDDFDSNTVTELDAATRQVDTATPIAGPTTPTDVLFDPVEGTIWVAGYGDGKIEVINPSTHSQVPSSPITLPSGATPSGMTYGAGRIWVVDPSSNSVRVINPVALAVDGPPISVGTTPNDIAYGCGSLWVTNEGSNTVSRIDPVTRAIIATIPVGNTPDAITYGGNGAHVGMWVANYHDDNVTFIPCESGVVVTKTATQHNRAITYKLSYKNAGPTKATKVNITDPIPTGLKFVNKKGGPCGSSVKSRTVNWCITKGKNSLKPGKKGAVLFTASIGKKLHNGDSVTNCATIHWLDAAKAPAKAVSCVTVTIK